MDKLGGIHYLLVKWTAILETYFVLLVIISSNFFCLILVYTLGVKNGDAFPYLNPHPKAQKNQGRHSSRCAPKTLACIEKNEDEGHHDGFAPLKDKSYKNSC